MGGSRALLAAAGVAVGMLGTRALLKLVSGFRKYSALLQQYHGDLIASPEQLEQIRADFLKQLEDGLHGDVPPTGKQVLMLTSYVSRLPNGHEVGDVYAIDLGGTNFRVMYVHLADAKSLIGQQDTCSEAIPREIYTGTGTQLFDFLAEVTVRFMDQHEGCSNTKSGKPPIIGFCFSFPMKQTALNKGVVLDWTKGFTCDGVIGNDPVELFTQALERAGKTCHVTALLNDTVGVFAAQRYLDPDTSIGVIIGTGTNACYVEKVGRVTKWKPGQALSPDTETCINIEWGAFESAHLPRCAEDWEVDAATVHKGKYMFEKLLSGLYLGEVARRVLLRMAKDEELALFGMGPSGPVVPPALEKEGGFASADLASIVGVHPLLGSRAMHSALGVSLPLEARHAVHQVCRMVALRSAKLVACALHAILQHSGWTQQPKRMTVAFDGSVYEQFGAYRAMLRHAMVDMLGAATAKLVVFKVMHDGSCLGAAVLAAAAAEEIKGAGDP